MTVPHGGAVPAQEGSEPAPTDITVLGLDVGGTVMKGLVVDATGTAVRHEQRPTPSLDGPIAVVEAIRTFAADLCTESGVGAVGLAVPGLVDPVAGRARYAANLGWRDVPLAALVENDVGVPVRVDHDVRTAGLAEAELGAARGCRDFLFVAIGTGVAAAACVGGAMLAGHSGAAGELGHIPIYPDGLPCACGQRGCLETYASAAAIARRYASRTGYGLDAATVASRINDDPVAAEIWAEAAAALGIALATYTLIADPGLIVLGGGLSNAGEALVTPVVKELGARLTWLPPPRVAVAELGSDAGCVGATLLARRAADPAGRS
jgi:glucokinase